jgi:hypothetical protein
MAADGTAGERSQDGRRQRHDDQHHDGGDLHID